MEQTKKVAHEAQVLINFFDNVLVVVSAVINSACQFLWFWRGKNRSQNDGSLYSRLHVVALIPF